MRVRRLFLIIFIFFVVGQILNAQSGKIEGFTKDNNGNPIPYVNVILEGTYMGAASDENGYYAILNVPPGVYDITASMIGYKKVTKIGVQVNIDQVTRVNFELEKEVIKGEEVIVVAKRDILHKEVSGSQIVVTSEQVDLTSNVRTVNDFLGNQAGVTNARYLSIRGGSPDQTGLLVNGISLVNPRINKAESDIPLSAIEQISLQSGGYSAKYGNFRSGIVQITTKTGSEDRYNISFNFSRNLPHMKRFGKSLYDPTNFGLFTYTDPLISFIGSNKLENWLLYTKGDTAEAEYLRELYSSTQFAGWNTMANRYNRRIKDPEDQVTPLDLYLWSAWIHMTVPDFEKLEELHGDEIYAEFSEDEWKDIKKKIKEHAHEPEGSHADWDLDFGVGGPVPLIGKYLGNATFYLANKTTNFNYVQPVYLDAERRSVTILNIKSQLSKNLILKLNGAYRKVIGTQQSMPTGGDIPDLYSGGDFMPIDNLETFVGGPYGHKEDTYYWHPTFWQPKYQDMYVIGFSLNRIISSRAYWMLTASYTHVWDHYTPKENRDRSWKVSFGPIHLNEMPYGILFHLPDKVWTPDSSDYYVHDEFEAPFGVPRRFNSKVGEFYENSVTQQVSVRFDYGNQINMYNQIETGWEINYYDIKNDNWKWWRNHDTLYELRDRRYPWQLGAYIQDRISYKGIEANIGIRFDYYNSGGGLWPTGDPYSLAFDQLKNQADWYNRDTLFTLLSQGVPVIWSFWKEFDKEHGGNLLQKTKNYYAISPRIGISFPVTERSKFYFNYGHFRSMLPFSQQYMYKQRFEKHGLYSLGNPNLEPARTISYELGVAYNLKDMYLIEISTYYKDVTGEANTITYLDESGVIDYRTYVNNRWETDQGLELRISKNYGKYFTGWLNLWFIIDKHGIVGRHTVYEDESRNLDPQSLYADDVNQPQTLPRFTTNISFHTPIEWGPNILSLHPFGGWVWSTRFDWRKGARFTYNPVSEQWLVNNLKWPDYYMVDMKFSKTFKLFGAKAQFYVDVNNVFNIKVTTIRDRLAFRDDIDWENYMKSLHLPEYNRKSFLDAGFIPGNDKIGDLRSKEKPYINDPARVNEFMYTNPRDIWIGIKIEL